MVKSQKTPDASNLENVFKGIVGAISQDLVALLCTHPAFLRMNGDQGRFKALAVVNCLEGGIRKRHQTVEAMNFELLAVERSLFESDVVESSLLEVGATWLLLPYKTIAGKSYLERWGKKFKKKKITESVTNIVLEHPDLASEFLIDSRYFVQDTLQRLSHIFPETSGLSPASDEDGSRLLNEYVELLKELESEGVLRLNEGLVAIDEGFVDEVLSQRVSASDQLRKVQKTMFSLLKLGLSGIDVFDRSPIFLKRLKTDFSESTHINPERYLYFPTAKGLSSFFESVNIDAAIKTLDPLGLMEEMAMRRLGSIFNEVYLITFKIDEGQRQAILKRFPTWGNLKWAPLAIWAIGTQNFAILGRVRMERECAATNLLLRYSINVPNIIYTYSLRNKRSWKFV